MQGRAARRATSLFAVVVAMVASILAPAEPANAAVANPRYVRTIGGQGRPGVFSWGVQWNPVTNEILVGDYLHFKIRRYDLNGNHLGDFWRDDAYGQPYSIAVDPNDGSIYVGELKDNPLSGGIAKYDRFGNFIMAIPSRTGGNPPPTGATYTRAFYTVWMTIEEDTGDIFTLDSHYQNYAAEGPRVLQLRFDEATKTVSQINAWYITPPDVPSEEDCTNPFGCEPRLYGIDITTTTEGDPNNDIIYLSDAWNRRGYRYAKDGTYLSSFGQTQTGGDNRSVTVNEALNRVYLVDAENSDIDMFNMAGSYLGSFSDEGTDPGEFSGGGRQLDIDGQNNVWVGDFGGFETEKFSATGTPLLTAPSPARKPPTGLLGQPRDVAVDDQTGDVWVADAWNQRFQRFNQNGQLLGSWGQRGPGGPFDMNYPRTIAIDPVTRRLWIANERGHHIQVYNYPTTQSGAPTYVTQIGQIGADDIEPNHFRWPVDVEFYTRPDGTRVAVIGDRMASSVKVFNANTYQEILNPADTDPSDGAPMIARPNHGTAVDPATGNIYMVNPSNDRVEVYTQDGVAVNNWLHPTNGTPVNYFGSSGNGNGQMRDPVDAVIAGGALYVSDESLSRVTIFNLDGTFVGKWGSTYGSNIYDFKGAIGIDANAAGTRLYVTDTGNDRIQVFDTTLSRQYETTAPSAPTVSAPAQQAVLPLGPVTLTGTATDNVAVGQVELSIQDYTTGKWWNANNQSWETNKTSAIAAWSGSAATSVNWRWVFLGVSQQGRYVAEIKTRDHNANISSVVMRTFAMTGATAPPVPPPPVLDTTRPNGTQTAPTAGQVFPRAPIAFSGTGTDNVGVTSVRIAIKRTTDGRWFSGYSSSGNANFSTGFTWHETTLDNPGAAAVNWSWTWNPPSAGGSFQTLVEARDAAGNVDSSKPQIAFTTTNLPPDTNAPDTTITAPAEGASLPTGPVAITGDATDDSAVGSVRVGIQDTATSQWWTGSAWSATATTVNATLGTPNATATSWSYTFNAPSAGAYAVTATAADTSNNSDATPATVSFSTVGAPDTTPPDATVAVPTNNQAFPLGPVAMSGTATDNVGVASVRVAIRNNATNQWWNGSTWGTFTYLDAAIDTPGGTSTGWTYTWTPPATGSFGLLVAARDGAGTLDPTKPWRSFTVT